MKEAETTITFEYEPLSLVSIEPGIVALFALEGGGCFTEPVDAMAVCAVTEVATSSKDPKRPKKRKVKNTMCGVFFADDGIVIVESAPNHTGYRNER